MTTAKKIDTAADDAKGGALITVEGLNPVEIFSEGGTDALIAKIEREVESFVCDPTTDEGRKEARALARRVSSSKVILEEMGKALTEDWRKQTGIVNAEKSKLVTRLDALRDRIKKPADDWEAAEKARIEGLKNRLNVLKALADFGGILPKSAAVKDRITLVDQRYAGDWDTFLELADTAKAEVLHILGEFLKRAEEQEAKDLELENLRKEKEERERKDREATAAQEAKEKAEKDAQAKAEKDRLDAETRTREQAERAAKAEADKKTAEENLEREKEASKIREKEAADKARQDEIDRQKREKDAEDKAAADREANAKHRNKVIASAITSMVANTGLTEDQATEAVTAIVADMVTNVKISF